jgi:hypothetical protein
MELSLSDCSLLGQTERPFRTSSLVLMAAVLFSYEPLDKRQTAPGAIQNRRVSVCLAGTCAPASDDATGA